MVRLREFSLEPNSYVRIRELEKWTGRSPFFDPAVAAAEQTVLNQDFSQAEKETGVVGMAFDGGRDGLFGLGKVPVEDGLFGGSDGGIKEGAAAGPFLELADADEGTG
ncbi:MAG: hypothetical protein ACKODZ_10220, partial [Verrucomicrobiota bacterium]